MRHIAWQNICYYVFVCSHFDHKLMHSKPSEFSSCNEYKNCDFASITQYLLNGRLGNDYVFSYVITTLVAAWITNSVREFIIEYFPAKIGKKV